MWRLLANNLGLFTTWFTTPTAHCHNKHKQKCARFRPSMICSLKHHPRECLHQWLTLASLLCMDPGPWNGLGHLYWDREELSSRDYPTNCYVLKYTNNWWVCLCVSTMYNMGCLNSGSKTFHSYSLLYGWASGCTLLGSWSQLLSLGTISISLFHQSRWFYLQRFTVLTMQKEVKVSQE